jgi:molybdopterin-guanine dinucleotide biosynthesis protein B
VLIEGFKQGAFPKLEVWRAALGKPTLWPQWPGVAAIASDTPAALPPGVRALDLADVHAIADLALAHASPYAA